MCLIARYFSFLMIERGNHEIQSLSVVLDVVNEYDEQVQRDNKMFCVYLLFSCCFFLQDLSNEYENDEKLVRKKRNTEMNVEYENMTSPEVSTVIQLIHFHSEYYEATKFICSKS